MEHLLNLFTNSKNKKVSSGFYGSYGMRKWSSIQEGEKNTLFTDSWEPNNNILGMFSDSYVRYFFAYKYQLSLFISKHYIWWLSKMTFKCLVLFYFGGEWNI